MNTSTYIFTNNSLLALLKDLSSEEEHQILGGTKISHKPVCKSKLKTEIIVLRPPIGVTLKEAGIPDDFYVMPHSPIVSAQ